MRRRLLRRVGCFCTAPSIAADTYRRYVPVRASRRACRERVAAVGGHARLPTASLALPSRAYSSRAGRRAESRRRHRVAFAALLLWQIPRRSLCCRSPKCTSICLEQRIPSSSGLGRPLRQRAKRPLTLIASLFVKERRSLWTAKAFQRQPSDLTHILGASQRYRCRAGEGWANEEPRRELGRGRCRDAVQLRARKWWSSVENS